MLTFPTSTLFIEGPDCSGKTSLINQIHAETKYSWHIMDRSQFSRKLFCDLYNRVVPTASDDLYFEMGNLNNRYVFLLPPLDAILSRFEDRGDELHDKKSLIQVYKTFGKHVERIRTFPNVTVIYDEPSVKDLSKRVCTSLHFTEKPQLREVSDQVIDLVAVRGDESYPVKFTLYDDGKFEEADPEILNYKPESEYYQRIFSELHNKITDELAGKNEYDRVEDHTSRRFVYSDSTCISFIQVGIRDRIMDFHVVIRSTDVKEIFPYDLKFLYYLASTCFNRFNDVCNGVRLRFDLNSAHIIR